MNPRPLAILLLLVPGPIVLQHPADPPSAPAAAHSVTYRGFAPGISYRDLLVRAQTLAEPGALPLVCNTSRHTAQLIECGGFIRDPADNARFYLSAHLIDGRVDFVSFGDSGAADLVQRRLQELRGHFGTPRRAKNGMWEWGGPEPASVIRIAWRGRGSARWIYISLWDSGLMKGIHPYVPAAGSRN